MFIPVVKTQTSEDAIELADALQALLDNIRLTFPNDEVTREKIGVLEMLIVQLRLYAKLNSKYFFIEANDVSIMG